jgi:valyl-tRNA synthetase
MNEAKFGGKISPQSLELSVNKWIIGELYKCAASVTEAIEDYRFNDAASAVYHFTWDVLCDWYLELSKPILNGDDAEAKSETQAVLGWVLEQTFIALHPFMPFVTEVLWEQTAERPDFLMQQSWPGLTETFEDQAAADELGWVLKIISQIRSVRSDVNVPAGAKVPVSLVDTSEDTARCVDAHRDVIMRLARLETFSIATEVPPGSVKTVVNEATVVLEIADLIDASEEIARLDKQLGKLGGEITGLEKRLGNEAFVAKAPAEVVAEQKTRLDELQGTRDKLSLAREQLAAL